MQYSMTHPTRKGLLIALAVAGSAANSALFLKVATPIIPAIH
jgi:hypothetical protein